MKPYPCRRSTGATNMSPVVLATLTAVMSFGTLVSADELPPELPLWSNESPEYPFALELKEQVRSLKAQPGSPTGLNRAFSNVATPTYSVHRPKKPNGVGLIICPGGGFRDIWIDREGHDLALWLKDHNVTSLVLKYRTRPPEIRSKEMWQDYQNAVQADGRQAIRILRSRAKDLGIDSHKIGICGFSAGGHLALSCALNRDPKAPQNSISGMPDFAGLFYPGIPDGALETIASRAALGPAARPVCPMFIVNARVDKLTPAENCVAFYAALLKAGANAELHVYSKGAHGFGMGQRSGEATALWPASFVAWLHDLGFGNLR